MGETTTLGFGRYLEKRTTQEFIPGSPHVPADPGTAGQPARAAYCTTRVVIEPVASSYIVPLGEGVPVGLPSGASVQPIYRQVVDPGPGLGVIQQQTGWLVFVPANTEYTVQQCFPARPAVPATPPTPAVPMVPGQWRADMNLGWNAGAQSIQRLGGDLFTTFQVGQAVGIGVGFSRQRGADDYRAIEFCMRFVNGQLRIFEGGTARTNNRAYQGSDFFTILRVDSRVEYRHNNDVVYRSERLSTASLIVVTALYSGLDRVI